jgi:hypothetical protein
VVIISVVNNYATTPIVSVGFASQFFLPLGILYVRKWQNDGNPKNLSRGIIFLPVGIFLVFVFCHLYGQFFCGFQMFGRNV